MRGDIMWISIENEPIPTYGMNGKKFLLSLHYKNYYGHNILKCNEVVTAIWDSINECFYEISTKKTINREDITEWWKE